MATLALILGWSNASAQTDKTSSVKAWSGGSYTSATDKVALNENYVAYTTSTGNIFEQTISDLDQGYYKVTLYANAIYTPERGFTSDASDFDSDRVFIFATGNSVTKKTAVPIKYGIITSGSEAYTVNAYVGADGNLTIGMAKDKEGTNWHTIATKSLYYYGNDLTIIKSELNTEISTAEGLSVASSEEATLNAAIDVARGVYNSGSATFDEVDAAITTLKIAEKYAKGGFSSATIGSPVLTDFVVNGDFTSFTEDWPNGGWFTTAGVGNHGQMTEGSEKAWENYSFGSLSGKMYFRMTDIPNGAYSVSIDGFSRTAPSTYAYANKERVYLTTNEAYETKVIPVIVKNNILEVGLYSGKIDWMKIKNVSVSYTGDPLASYKNTIASLIETGEGLDMTGIPTSVSEAMTNDINTYKPAYSAYTEEEECTTAISALQISVQKAQAYVNAKAVVDKMTTLISNNNLYTTDAYNTFYAYITKFNNAEYTTEEANALNGVIFGTGWRSTAAVDDFLISAWDVEPRTWTSYHVNTWSTTGNSGNPNFVVPCIEYWVGDASTLEDKTMTATLSGFVPGTEYKVNATICVGVNTGVDASTTPTGITLQLNDGDAVSVCTGSRIESTRFYEEEFEATGMIGLDEKLNVKVNVASTNASWITIRNITYTKTADVAVPTSEELSALDAAITIAEGKTLGFENGEYAPYNNVEALEALEYAKHVNTASKLAVTTATTNLEGATWTANDGNVECVYNGDFSQGDWGLTGWTRTNSWGKNLPSDEPVTAEILIAAGATTGHAYYNQPGSLQYGNAGVYTMPLKANTIYNLTFKYASWKADSNDGMTVSVLNNEDGMAAMVFPENNTLYSESGAFVTKTLVFVTGAAGDYVLTLKNNGNTVMTDVSITKAANQYLEFADGSVPTYAPGTYPSVKITRTLTANRWATAIYPFAVSGVDYLAVFDRYNDATEVMGFSSAAASTANEPFLMKSIEGTSEITLSNVAVEAINATDVTYGNASLKGVYATTTVKESDNAYVISENVIYPASETGATVNPYRAYIQVTGTGARGLSFVIDDEETTAIDGIETVKNGNMKVYNLNGQRVEKPGKGLYIVNGKKLLVK